SGYPANRKKGRPEGSLEGGTTMPGHFEGAGHKGIPGSLRALHHLTIRDLMMSPPKAVRPTWMVTSFPVSLDEFFRLKAQAAAPGKSEKFIHPDPGHAARAPSMPAPEQERPEDVPSHKAAIATPSLPQAAPSALAPVADASFDGLAATAWSPPDCSCAVGPDHVLLAVNTDLAGYDKSGTPLFGWANLPTLFKNVLPQGAGFFDPRLAYDP